MPLLQYASNNPKKINILFIGNSYTYYNDMPTIFKNIAAEQGIDLNVTSVTKGGYSLSQLADITDKYGKLADDTLKTQKFDVTFLQEQSILPITDNAKFLSGATKLNEKIKQNGSKTVLYQTWGRNSNSPDLKSLDLTTASMSKNLATAYQNAAKELSCIVSPVGDAFLDVFENHPSVDLYNPDDSHPSIIGSTLAALCHFVTLFGKITTTPTSPSIPPHTMQLLTAAANNTITT